jgi:hypothetical protein
MKNLTKVTMLVTVLSTVSLGLTWNVSQSLETDGTYMYDVTVWQIPFYETVYFLNGAWWILVRIWLVSLALPPVFWAAVGVRTLLAKWRRRN